MPPVQVGWPAPPQAGLPVAWQLPAWQVWVPVKPHIPPLSTQTFSTQQLPAPQSLLSQQVSPAPPPQVSQKPPPKVAPPQLTPEAVQKAAAPA